MDDLDNNSDNKDLEELIPFEDETSEADISHSPLNLGGASAAEVPKLEVTAQPARPAEEVTSADRITGVKNFFTKLHPGAIDFLSEQITKWLNDNPDIVIKRTNMVTGNIQAKKVDPNLIITVWY